MKAGALFSLLFFLACQPPPASTPDLIPDGVYDSVFPRRDVARELERVSQSVLKIYFTAFYDNYFFAPEDSVTDSTLAAVLATQSYRRKISFNRSSFGTATVIAHSDGETLLLSCAHIGNFPDTLRTRYPAEHGAGYLESVALRSRSNFFLDHEGLKGDLELVASDLERDIALFGHRQSQPEGPPVAVFPFVLGRMERVAWGSVVYMMGYPIGHKMVTQALLSPAETDGGNSFLVDALFNKGFSGGVVLAVKDGLPHLELVGLAKSISAQTDYYLVPDSRDVLQYGTNPNPYTGNLYVLPKRTLHYGVTYCVSATAIRAFLSDSRDAIRRQGYPFPHDFLPDP